MTLLRPTRLTKASAALGVAVVIGAVLAPGAARAADDYTNIFEATAGRLMENLGLSSNTSSRDINYQERPPLVIPSNQALPPPEKVDKTANPAWPKDPDVARRKQREKEEAKREPGEAYLRERNPLPPDQLTPGARPRGVRAPIPESSPTLGTLLSPSELGYKSGGFFGKLFHWGKDDPESVKFTGEPARTSLTEPPPGYQTPSPDQPYGVGPPAPAKAEDTFYKSKELPTGK